MANRTAIALTLCLAAWSVSWALDFEEYPQFRYLSGLPGGGFGVDYDGTVGFAGAMQMTIPVGYTPASGNWVLVGAAGAVNGGLQIDLGGDDVNGSAVLGAGFGKPENALWLAHMSTGDNLISEPAYNLQWQLLPETAEHAGVAVGVVDLLNMRPERLSHIFEGGGRSFYAVATRQAGTPDHPQYWTIGFGTGRYNDRPFGGLCYQASDRLKLMAEYDGFNPNVAAAGDLWSNDQWHAIGFLGLIDLDRFNVGLSVTRAPAR